MYRSKLIECYKAIYVYIAIPVEQYCYKAIYVYIAIPVEQYCGKLCLVMV